MRVNAAGLLRLLRGELRGMTAGDRLPTVRELMRCHGVSQSVVAQALQALRQEGLIEAQVGRGTFVTAAGVLRQVLWVCGVDLYHGEISTYYTHHLRLAKETCAQHGLSLTAAWLSNYRFADALPYCTPEATDKFAGFLFVACQEDHPFLRYVKYRELPHARMCFAEAPFRSVSADLPSRVDLVLKHFRQRGHREVALMCDTYGLAVFRDRARLHGLTVEHLPVQLERGWLADHHRAGYRCLMERLARQPWPRALFVQDDIVAVGACQALLGGMPEAVRGQLDIVVSAAMQTMVPLGLPVTYVVTDIAEEAAAMAAMLLDQVDGNCAAPTSRPVTCRLVEGTSAAMGWGPASPAETAKAEAP